MTPEFRFIDSNRVRIRAAVAGDGPLVVLIHGFPESWYSWRHQIGPLAEAGYRVAAIDMRGYGGSDRPDEVAAYDMQAMTGDVAAVIAALSPDAPAVVIGHDWGAPVAWHAALYHPQRVRAVAGMSVPWLGIPAEPPTHMLQRMFADRGRFFYILHFQPEGVAEAELAADVRATLLKLHAGAGGPTARGWPGRRHGEPLLPSIELPATLPPWLSEADLAYYVAEFERSGFRGPLNRYRNFERDHARMLAHGDPVIRQPALYISGAADPLQRLMTPALVEATMPPLMPNLRGIHFLPGVGHWVQQEAPAEVNRLLLDWLAGLG